VDVQTTVMVGWRKGWASKGHTYLVEIGQDTVWFGRLGQGGAYWSPTPGLPDYAIRNAIRQANRVGSTSVAGSAVGGALGGALARAGTRKVFERFRAEIGKNERRYHAEGRAALDRDKHTVEWPSAEFADARLVKRLPATAPQAVQGLDGGFIAVTLGGKPHFFGGLPGGTDAETFLAALVAAAQR